MGDAQQTLFALAEVAIALAGFSAIVVVLKRSDQGTWTLAAADRFHGMIIHAICAVVFSLLPVVVNVMVQDVATTLHVVCALLGAQMIAHCIGVMRFATTDQRTVWFLSLGLVIGLLQFAVFIDWGVLREFEIYTVGVIWHILQAGVLFVMLIWIPKSAIADQDSAQD